MWKSLLLSVALLGGCTHRVHVVVDPREVPAEQQQRWVNGWLFHLVGGSASAFEMCGGRPVVSVRSEQSVGNWFIGVITLGIYTPMRVSVRCATYDRFRAQRDAPHGPPW